MNPAGPSTKHQRQRRKRQATTLPGREANPAALGHTPVAAHQTTSPAIALSR